MKGADFFRKAELFRAISGGLLTIILFVVPAEAETDRYCPAGDILYLASFSLPDSSFMEIFRSAFLHDGRVRVVFRGLPEKKDENKPIWSLKDVTRKLKPLIEKAVREVRNSGADTPGKLRLAIDPRPFAKFKVKAVPTYIFCDGTDSPRMLIGDVSLDIAKYYLTKFSDKRVVEYGPRYEIKERDLRIVMIDLSRKMFKEPNLKEVAQRARKRLFTGWQGLERATEHRRREIRLADLIMKARDELLFVLEKAMEEEVPVETTWKEVFSLDREKAEEIARKVVLVSAGEEVLMVDARDPAQVKFALAEIEKNPRAVVLMAGPMEEYYFKYPMKVFPLKRWQAEKWEIRGLPARLRVRKDGVVVVEEGFPVPNVATE